jgi:hypothetical protein
MRREVLYGTAVSALALSSQAMATLSMNHGNALFVDTAPATTTTTHYGGGGTNTTDVFRPDGGATTFHMFETGWSWRINGVDLREFAFSQAGMVESGSGTALGTRSYASLAGGAFSAVFTYALTDGGAPGQALMTQTLTITNTSANALDMSIFNYADFDIGGTFAGDSGSWFDQSNNIMGIQDGANFGRYQGVGANAWQVTAFSTLRTSLTNTTITNLNNTGLPFLGDFTAAFQWNNMIAVGGSASFVAQMAINQQVPAPGALALLGLAGLVGARRRRA